MPGLAQHAKRFSTANAALLADRGNVGRDMFAPLNGDHQCYAGTQNRRAHQQQVVGAELFHGDRREAGSCRPSKARAAANEPEQSLRLTRIVDVIGERPELTDEQMPRMSPIT